MIWLSDHDAEMQRRVYDDASTFHELRGLWKIMHDYASEFTTPRERLAAADRLRALLD
jgi:hypothetical protein